MRAYVVTTPYHLLVACSLKRDDECLLLEDQSWIHSEFAKNCIQSFFLKHNYIIPSYTELTSNPIKARYLLYRWKKNLQLFTLQDIEQLYCFNDADPMVQFIASHMKKEAVCVVLEEGIGLYNNMHHKHKLLKKLLGKILFGFWYECVNRIGEYSCSKIIMAKVPCKLDNDQLQKKIIQYDYKEVAEFIKTYNQNNEYDVVFIGQPLVEDGICPEISYLNIITKCSEICEKYSRKFVLKKHPREGNDKYFNSNFEIVDSDIPIELLVSFTSKCLMISISSSSVLNFIDYKNVKIGLTYPLLETKIDFSVFNTDSVVIIKDWCDLEKMVALRGA